jgi:glycerophosphoryl diester phosphodiesterase
VHRRVDPIFSDGYSHPVRSSWRRKGVPESTERAFHHATKTGTDVFEIDIQLTRDEQMVVWHGPNLDNVRLAIEENQQQPRSRPDIGDYDWSELRGKAWVADPGTGNDRLRDVPKDPDRVLLSFEEFLKLFPTAVLNVELKECFRTRH